MATIVIIQVKLVPGAGGCIAPAADGVDVVGGAATVPDDEDATAGAAATGTATAKYELSMNNNDCNNTS